MSTKQYTIACMSDARRDGERGRQSESERKKEMYTKRAIKKKLVVVSRRRGVKYRKPTQTLPWYLANECAVIGAEKEKDCNGMSVKLSNGTQHTNRLKGNGKKDTEIRGEERKKNEERQKSSRSEEKRRKKPTIETITYHLNTIVFVEFLVRMLEFRDDDNDCNDDDFVN